MFENFKRWFFQNSKGEKERPLNLYEYKFKRFKEERDALYPLKLSKVETPHIKGLISVVLPVYNGADLVSLSIESVLNQTEKNFEFIIINDGSKDNTLEIINEYAKKDDRIVVIDQENKRIPRTLSRGFSVAKGEFFTWTSADNIMPCDFLEKMKKELLENPDKAMVFGNMRLINEKGKTHKNHGWFEYPLGSGNVILPKSTLELNTYANNTIGAAFMYRAKAKEVIGCYSSYKHTLEDYDYWMRMNSLLNIHHTSFREPAYLYRWHSGSLTAKDKELGITKNRYKLMLLDDARRDFYMSPLLWYVKADETYKNDADAFCGEISKRNHILVRDKDFEDLCFGKESYNLCAVFFGDAKSGVDLPKGTAKVHFGKEYVEDAVCGYVGEEEIISSIDKLVYKFSDMETAFSFMDAKVKNDLMYGREAVIESEKENGKKLSFILCTHRMSDVLKESLDALINQSAKKSDYEIIFVNNSFKDREIRDYVYEVMEKNPETAIKYITAPVKGLSNARNAGLWEAEGEILHYVDDDAIADRSLAEKAIKAFSENEEAGVIGGNIILEIPKDKENLITSLTRPLWSELSLDFESFKYSKDYGEYPYGANFAVRRQTLMQMGGFRTIYGRVGNNYAGGEETLVCFMTEEMGQKIGLEPLMKVIHKVAPERFCMEHIEKTAYAGLFTQYKMRRDVYAPQDWNDILLSERKRKAQGKMKSCEEGSPDYMYYKATAKAYEDIITKRQEDYINLQNK